MPLSPRILGAPRSISSFRPQQLDFIYRQIDQDRPTALVSAPTGAGKMVMAWSAGAVAKGTRTLILTANKTLQDAYVRTLAGSGMFDVGGQSNYPCRAVEGDGPLSRYARYGRMCDSGPCHHGVWCPLIGGGCDYFDAVRRAGDEEIVLTNYSMWLTGGKGLVAGRTRDEPFGKFDRIVCDEAHLAVDELTKALKVELNVDELRTTLAIQPLVGQATAADWAKWAERCLEMLSELQSELRRSMTIAGLTTEHRDTSVAARRLREQLEQIAQVNEDWVITDSDTERRAYQPRGRTITFEPVWPRQYAERLLFRGIDRRILLSATLTRRDADYLGIAESEYEFVEYPSTFDPRRQPVYILRDMVPKVFVDHQMSEADEQIWMGYNDAVMRSRVELDRKGIVHCVSYVRSRRIAQLSKHRHLMIMHGGSGEKREALEQFRGSRHVAILNSPSVNTGEDFPDDQCRWILIPKLPVPDMRSPVMRRRQKEDKNYSLSLMMRTFIQSTGRGMRSRPDWCESIVTDAHAEYRVPAGIKLGYAPQHWVERIVWTNRLPAPLQVPEAA